MGNKQPVSVLVVIHTADLQVLLLERADYPGSWQSVTGSREGEETPWQTARREVQEETGLDASQYGLSDWQQQNRYEIYPKWRHRYPDGVTHNTEHVLSLRSAVNLEIWHRFAKAGIAMSFPQREVRILNPSSAGAGHVPPEPGAPQP